MLMTQRSWIDAMRCLIYENAAALDRAGAETDLEAAQRQQEWADLLIPLSKSLCTDLGNELTSLALQVHGGMGFVEETGVAQHYRDVRIAAIYEGTNGIQAADLVGRKLPMRGGAVVAEQLDVIAERAKELSGISELAIFAANLESAVEAAHRSTRWIIENGLADPNNALAAASPYLRLLGTVVCGGLMAKAAMAANEHLAEDEDYHRARIVSAKFFGEQLLPPAAALEGAITAGAADLFALSPAQLG